MALQMKIQNQSIKFIKPFVPTPPTLRHYKLGIMDELIFSENLSVVLFFSTNSNHTTKYVAFLEKSLEKSLTQFYPLAGRYDEETRTIDCNDQGAKFINAKVNIKLQDILVSHKNVIFLDEFIPSKLGASQRYNDSLLAIQVTTFECGGVAIGVSGTHKLVDASTLCTFISEWAVMNREGNETKFNRSFFNSSSLFPGRGLRSMPPATMSDDVLSKYIRMKLSFNESVISNLRLKGNSSSRRWSKVQLVTAIIWKALIHVDTIMHSFPRESILIQPVSVREKMASLIPRNSCGNLWGVCAIKSKTHETTEEMTNRLSDSVKKTLSDFSKVYHNSEEGQMMILNSWSPMINIDEFTNMICITSWCKFPFYEADFGFGKPILAVPGTLSLKNSVFLMDDVGDNGVDAYVFLEVKDVPYFEEALDHVNVFSA